ncbi:SIMPL domain-containing protein [Acidipropionibacterium acidipropionici]|uniref:SIMPL domain-containing protein n=2 Tax=Acidipropionibacterium acidipropionici TaxID=1748 RepID=A0AAC9AN44_9ACTN|nr:hypothetical protein AXH35_05610 [Acidipropionibacterium acidipropionici]AOZ46500.1 hypothetical protein A8L58_07075 [Acidipropionibacterium acidipropionici]AZP37450.1 SIMPL domain-containing protein [Acidipropionibacterium acidipropionici]
MGIGGSTGPASVAPDRLGHMIITVAGTFTLDLPAERGIVTLTSGAEGGDRGTVARQATSTTESLRHQLVELEENGAATWFSVGALTTRAWRPYNSDGTVMPIRYRTSSPITVKFADFSALSGSATTWAETAGLTVDDVTWALTEKTRDQMADEVLAGAVRDATHRAEVLALAAGLPAPRILAIADPGLLSEASGARSEIDDDYGHGVRMMSAMSRGGSEAVELSPADITVRESVHARFEA